MHALLIEDDDTIADFVARGLREAGFAVDRAADGAEGLESALAQTYDVAVVDVMLPRRDGLSVIEELRRKGVAVCVRGTSGAGAGAGAARLPHARSDDADGGGSRSGPSFSPCHPRGNRR